ncbi:MAG: hypothetical protein KDB04_12840 [Acidimicrobiales bacterium]|nr:hypothetical protein [Acidimicrobiales bacterium]HRW38488.1 hypothetical protein [Aquihabitans sp.]
MTAERTTPSTPAAVSADRAATVTLVVPADVRYFRSVRLAVGGLATLVGFDVEAIDDLRIGVDELCGALAEAGDGSDLTFHIETRVGESIRIAGRAPSGSGTPDADRSSFSHQILSVVADAHALDVDGPELSCWLERALADPETGS